MNVNGFLLYVVQGDVYVHVQVHENIYWLSDPIQARKLVDNVS